MSLAFLLLLAALVCFGVPAVRAILARGFDFTNTGLACAAAAMLVGGF